MLFDIWEYSCVNLWKRSQLQFMTSRLRIHNMSIKPIQQMQKKKKSKPQIDVCCCNTWMQINTILKNEHIVQAVVNIPDWSGPNEWAQHWNRKTDCFSSRGHFKHSCRPRVQWRHWSWGFDSSRLICFNQVQVHTANFNALSIWTRGE